MFTVDISSPELPLRTRELIINAYEDLWNEIENNGETRDGFKVPFIGDICELVYREMYLDMRMILIDEAIHRADDELFGFSSREQFIQSAWRSEIKDPSLEPSITLSDINCWVVDLLATFQLFYIDYQYIVRNNPLTEVW